MKKGLSLSFADLAAMHFLDTVFKNDLTWLSLDCNSVNRSNLYISTMMANNFDNAINFL